jgi:hypothetical protein
MSGCLESTRGEVIARISKWADQTDDRTIYWLFGPAGVGKSTIAYTVAERYARQKNNLYPNGRLAASFFFSRSNIDLSKTTHFFPTIAYQLAISLPSTRGSMEKALEADPSILFKKLDYQFMKLILDHIRPPAQSQSMRPMIVVIDGLDECEKESSASLIQVLAGTYQHSQPPLRFLITSRADDHIKEMFDEYPSQLYLLDLWEYHADREIRSFFKTRFLELYQKKRHRLMKGVQPPWPSELELDVLVKKAEGLFIYASTLVKFVGDG